MGKFKLLVVVLLIVIGFQNTYAQDKWDNMKDTVMLTEADVTDSTIITMLDSAFTFLRRPTLEYGVYYYSLIITKDTIPVVRPYCKVDLSVKDYFFNDEFGLNLFNQYDKLLFNYKGTQIIVIYNISKNDSFALQYFKPTNRKSNFNIYYRKNKIDPNIIFIPNNWQEQNVSFWVGKKVFRFMEYRLKINQREI